MPAIADKKEFYRLWELGLLGNKPRTWTTLEEAKASGFPGPMVIRCSGAGRWHKRRWFVSGVTALTLEREVKKLEALGCSRQDMNFAEQVDPATIKYVVHGEVMREVGGLCLFYSCRNQLFREALASDGLEVRGLRAKCTLQYFLTAGDYDDLMGLLDDYPGHIIEFSVVDRPVGLMGRHLLIWEIRRG